MERRGRGLVVVEALLNYRRPAFFDDELTLRTTLAELGKVSLRFDYQVLRDGESLVTGHTRHACIDLATGKPVRMPGGKDQSPTRPGDGRYPLSRFDEPCSRARRVYAPPLRILLTVRRIADLEGNGVVGLLKAHFPQQVLHPKSVGLIVL